MSKILEDLKTFFRGGLLEIPDFITKINSWWSDKLISNVSQNLHIAFWFVLCRGCLSPPTFGDHPYFPHTLISIKWSTWISLSWSSKQLNHLMILLGKNNYTLIGFTKFSSLRFLFDFLPFTFVFLHLTIFKLFQTNKR